MGFFVLYVLNLHDDIAGKFNVVYDTDRCLLIIPWHEMILCNRQIDIQVSHSEDVIWLRRLLMCIAIAMKRK